VTGEKHAGFTGGPGVLVHRQPPTLMAYLESEVRLLVLHTACRMTCGPGEEAARPAMRQLQKLVDRISTVFVPLILHRPGDFRRVGAFKAPTLKPPMVAAVRCAGYRLSLRPLGLAPRTALRRRHWRCAKAGHS